MDDQRGRSKTCSAGIKVLTSRDGESSFLKDHRLASDFYALWDPTKKMENISDSLEHVLVAALHQNCLTVGVYEAAKLLTENPDGAVLCVLVVDEGDEDDSALQIHFTLLQAFCYDNYLDILRVTGMRRLTQLLQDINPTNGNESRDLHCILVTNPPEQLRHCPALQQISKFCEESRRRFEWVPSLELQDR